MHHETEGKANKCVLGTIQTLSALHMFEYNNKQTLSIRGGSLKFLLFKKHVIFM